MPKDTIKFTGLMIIVILSAVMPTASASEFASEYSWGNLIISKVEFHETALSNLVSFLNTIIAKSITNVPPPTVRVSLNAIGPILSNSPFMSQGNALPQGIPKITFSARQIRLGCAIKTIADLAGLDCEADAHGAVFKRRSDMTGHRKSTSGM